MTWTNDEHDGIRGTRHAQADSVCETCGIRFGAHSFPHLECPKGYVPGFSSKRFVPKAIENSYLVSATVQMLVKAEDHQEAALRAQERLQEASRVDYAGDPMNGVVLDTVDLWCEEDI